MCDLRPEKNLFTSLVCAMDGDTRERVCLVKLSVCMNVCRVGDLQVTKEFCHLLIFVGPAQVPVRVRVERTSIHGSFVEDDSVFLGARCHFQRLGHRMTGEEVRVVD